MVTKAPAKARSDVEILVERFNEWADDRIIDYTVIPFEKYREIRKIKIDTLKWAKTNLERLAQEIVDGNSSKPTL